MVADVDALQGLYLRGVGPPLVARRRRRAAVVAAATSCPPPRLVLAAGLLVGGVAVPLLAWALARRPAAGRPPRAAS